MPTILAATAISSNAAVWMDYIKGWAAVATVVLGVPTSILILTYWFLKVRHELREDDKK